MTNLHPHYIHTCVSNDLENGKKDFIMVWTRWAFRLKVHSISYYLIIHKVTSRHRGKQVGGGGITTIFLVLINIDYGKNFCLCLCLFVCVCVCVCVEHVCHCPEPPPTITGTLPTDKKTKIAQVLSNGSCSSTYVLEASFY